MESNKDKKDEKAVSSISRIGVLEKASGITVDMRDITINNTPVDPRVLSFDEPNTDDLKKYGNVPLRPFIEKVVFEENADNLVDPSEMLDSQNVQSAELTALMDDKDAAVLASANQYTEDYTYSKAAIDDSQTAQNQRMNDIESDAAALEDRVTDTEIMNTNQNELIEQLALNSQQSWSGLEQATTVAVGTNEIVPLFNFLNQILNPPSSRITVASDNTITIDNTNNTQEIMVVLEATASFFNSTGVTATVQYDFYDSLNNIIGTPMAAISIDANFTKPLYILKKYTVAPNTIAKVTLKKVNVNSVIEGSAIKVIATSRAITGSTVTTTQVVNASLVSGGTATDALNNLKTGVDGSAKLAGNNVFTGNNKFDGTLKAIEPVATDEVTTKNYVDSGFVPKDDNDQVPYANRLTSYEADWQYGVGYQTRDNIAYTGDLNELREAGFYWANTADITANCPSTEFSITILVESNADKTAFFQTIRNINSEKNEMWVRNTIDLNTWTDWVDTTKGGDGGSGNGLGDVPPEYYDDINYPPFSYIEDSLIGVDIPIPLADIAFRDALIRLNILGEITGNYIYTIDLQSYDTSGKYGAYVYLNLQWDFDFDGDSYPTGGGFAQGKIGSEIFAACGTATGNNPSTGTMVKGWFKVDKARNRILAVAGTGGNSPLLDFNTNTLIIEKEFTETADQVNSIDLNACHNRKVIIQSILNSEPDTSLPVYSIKPDVSTLIEGKRFYLYIEWFIGLSTITKINSFYFSTINFGPATQIFVQGTAHPLGGEEIIDRILAASGWYTVRNGTLLKE